MQTFLRALRLLHELRGLHLIDIKPSQADVFVGFATRRQRSRVSCITGVEN
jgi:hypothetical protein